MWITELLPSNRFFGRFLHQWYHSEINGYPLTSYYPGSKITKGYPRKQRGARKKSQRKSRKATREMKDYLSLCSV